MGYEISWHEDQRIVYIRTFGHLSHDDMRESSRLNATWIREGVPPVHTIVDTRDVTKFPVGLKQFRKSLVHPQSRNLGWIIVIGSESIIKFSTTIIAQIFRFQFRVVPTLDDALQHLQRHDPTLTNLLTEVE